MTILCILSAFAVGWLCADSKLLSDFRKNPTKTVNRLRYMAFGDDKMP